MFGDDTYPSFTAKTYAHLIEKHKAKATNAIAGILVDNKTSEGA